MLGVRCEFSEQRGLALVRSVGMKILPEKGNERVEAAKLIERVELEELLDRLLIVRKVAAIVSLVFPSKGSETSTSRNFLLGRYLVPSSASSSPSPLPSSAVAGVSSKDRPRPSVLARFSFPPLRQVPRDLGHSYSSDYSRL